MSDTKPHITLDSVVIQLHGLYTAAQGAVPVGTVVQWEDGSRVCIVFGDDQVMQTICSYVRAKVTQVMGEPETEKEEIDDGVTY